MRMLIVLPLAVVVSAALTFPSSVFSQSVPPVVKQKVDAVQKHVKTIGIDEYRKIVEDPGAALIVDVREPHEYAAGHVPGSINIPRGVVESEILNHVSVSGKADMERPIVLQCQSGKRASLAAESLRDLGFTQTTVVMMNLDDWKKAGNPFVK
jgi:rhodanese-related sulfurtransferase